MPQAAEYNTEQGMNKLVTRVAVFYLQCSGGLKDCVNGRACSLSVWVLRYGVVFVLFVVVPGSAHAMGVSEAWQNVYYLVEAMGVWCQ